MKTTEAKISKDEINLFKNIRARPDEVRGTDGELRKVAGKPKKLPKKKVAAKDDPRVRAIAGDLLEDDDGVDIEASERAQTRAKERMVPNNGHHGGTPADQPPADWGIGQPERPKATTIARPQSVSSAKSLVDDELRKAQRRPMTRDELFGK